MQVRAGRHFRAKKKVNDFNDNESNKLVLEIEWHDSRHLAAVRA